MNTNIGEMPLEIFVDYCTEQSNLEWTLEHILLAASYGSNHENYGNGYGSEVSSGGYEYGNGYGETWGYDHDGLLTIGDGIRYYNCGNGYEY